MIRYLLLILLSFLIGCTNANEKESILRDYPYFKQLDTYFSKNTDTKIFELFQLDESIEFLFIIPLDSCTDCLSETLEKIIQNNHDKIGVIFLGRPKNDYHEQLQNSIKKINPNIYSKIENDIQLFETNVFGPTFFSIKNKKINYTPLTNQIWQDLTLELGWH